MKVLITGGAGYIGTGLVNQVVTDPKVNEVVIYDNLSRGNYNFFIGKEIQFHNKVRFVEGDILDSRKLKKHLQGIDVAVHLAAKVTTPFANTDSHFFEQINHWGTAELVYALESVSVPRVIFLSSSSVYGRSEELASEEKIPNPRTFYGISKLRAEDHVKRLFDNHDTYIIRCGNVYGYNKSVRFDSVINRFVFDANYQGRISINGDGTQARAFIHVDTIADVVHKLLQSSVTPGTYNAVSRNLQVLELVDVFKEFYPELEFMFINQHLNLRGIRVAINQAFFNELGIPETPSLIQEIKEIAEHLPFGNLKGI